MCMGRLALAYVVSGLIRESLSRSNAKPPISFNFSASRRPTPKLFVSYGGRAQGASGSRAFGADPRSAPANTLTRRSRVGTVLARGMLFMSWSYVHRIVIIGYHLFR